MATRLADNTANRNISLFANQQFDLGVGSSTLPKQITPLEKFLALKEKEKKERDKRVEELWQELDSCKDLEWRQTNAAKLIVESDGGLLQTTDIY